MWLLISLLFIQLHATWIDDADWKYIAGSKSLNTRPERYATFGGLAGFGMVKKNGSLIIFGGYGVDGLGNQGMLIFC